MFNTRDKRMTPALFSAVDSILNPKPVVTAVETTPVAVTLAEETVVTQNEEFEVPETVSIAEWGVGTVIAGTYNEETDTVDAIFEHGLVKGVLLEGRRGRPKMARDASGKIVRGEGGKGVKASAHAAANPLPKKDDGSAAPRGDGVDEEGGREHITMQLQKVLTMKGDSKGGKTVEFNNDEKVKVHPHHAAKALMMYHNPDMKASQKEDLQKELSASHTSFKKAIGV